jgi:hypothetical protein
LVNAIARFVRIYGSTSQYRAQDEPAPAPLQADGYPVAGDTMRVWFGPVPEEIAHHLQVLVAKGNARLNSLLRGEASVDDVIDRELTKVIADDQVGLDELYYVTIVVDRAVTLPDEALWDNRYEWIDPRVVEAPEDALASVAAQAIEMAVATMAPKLAPNRLISNRVVGRSYVFAADRDATSALRVRGSATGIGVHSLKDLPLDAMRERIAALPRRLDWHELEVAAHWYESMLQENDDDLKRFLWGFIALEALINTLFRSLRGAGGSVQTRSPNWGTIRHRRRRGIADRFEFVSRYLSPATVAEDAAKFRLLKEARDRIGHGGGRREALNFPTEVLAELLPRYFELAFDLPE